MNTSNRLVKDGNDYSGKSHAKAKIFGGNLGTNGVLGVALGG